MKLYGLRVELEHANTIIFTIENGNWDMVQKHIGTCDHHDFEHMLSLGNLHYDVPCEHVDADLFRRTKFLCNEVRYFMSMVNNRH